MVNDTTRLLGLDGLVVERVELDAAGVPVEDLAPAENLIRAGYGGVPTWLLVLRPGCSRTLVIAAA